MDGAPSSLPSRLLDRLREPRVALAIFCALLALARLRTYDEPLDRDITTYAVIGGEVLGHGRELYSDLWDHKPPAPYVTYGLFVRVFGLGPLAIYVLNVVAGWATLIGVY